MQIPSISGPVPSLINGGVASTSSWGGTYWGGSAVVAPTAFTVGGMLAAQGGFKLGGDMYMNGNNIHDLIGVSGVFTLAGLSTALGLAASLATKAPLPQSSTGVGQVDSRNSGAGSAWVLQAGGTWEYYGFAFSGAPATIQAFIGGFSAGGATIGAATSGWSWLVRAYRYL
jgi:hypothetical protein